MPLHEFPCFLLGLLVSARYHNDGTHRGDRDVVDGSVILLKAGQRNELPLTAQLGGEYHEVVVGSVVGGNAYGHFTGTETVCKVVFVRERVHLEQVAHLLERVKRKVGVKVYSHTVVGKERTAHLIKEYLVVVAHTDGHVVLLQLDDRAEHILPRLGDLDVELGKYIGAQKHHREVLLLGQTVAVCHAVGIGKLKNEHCRAGELLIGIAGGGVCDFGKAVHHAHVLKRAADSVVDNAVVAKTDVNVRSHARKNGGQQSAAGNQLKVYGNAGLGCEVVVYEVTYDLGLVASLCKPYFDRLVNIHRIGAHAVVVAQEALDEA